MIGEQELSVHVCSYTTLTAETKHQLARQIAGWWQNLTRRPGNMPSAGKDSATLGGGSQHNYSCPAL